MTNRMHLKGRVICSSFVGRLSGTIHSIHGRPAGLTFRTRTARLPETLESDWTRLGGFLQPLVPFAHRGKTVHLRAEGESALSSRSRYGIEVGRRVFVRTLHGSPARAGYRLTLDAWKMLSIAAPSDALNSASVWRTDRPSVKAREKLAIMPVLWLSLAFASSRE